MSSSTPNGRKILVSLTEAQPTLLRNHTASPIPFRAVQQILQQPRTTAYGLRSLSSFGNVLPVRVKATLGFYSTTCLFTA